MPTPYDYGLIDAEDQNGEVDAAIALASEHLRFANTPTRLIRRRSNDSAPIEEGSLAVYLVTEPGTAIAAIREMERLREKVAAFKLQDFQFDHAFANCGEADDCVENLYKAPNVTAIVLDTLQQITNSHVAEAPTECRCIVLYGRDLQRYQSVFGSPWGRFIVEARYAGEAPPANPSIPEIMLDDKGLAPRWLLMTILLHEVGHYHPEFVFQAPKGFAQSAITTYLSFLGTVRKLEEARADAFAADVMHKSCFSSGLSADARHSCVAAAYASLVFFGITLWGKTKEARCVRYFDPSVDYPNFHLRNLVRDVLAFDSSPGISLLEDFLRTRTALAKKEWIDGMPNCRRTRDATLATDKAF